jgi:hypothetical protein
MYLEISIYDYTYPCKTVFLDYWVHVFQALEKYSSISDLVLYIV